ncbi:Anaphase-promoting complex subunit 1 [Lithohypha guttulata]|uniref:Anaphase-promoting complex subunit 1 n=1 Tax=Lithohypha guttulata TaxID=1690604 RepID=UPI002DE0999C|nr:Anaphase-promoting complex subunit 1 [Lithohypha guttulata]
MHGHLPATGFNDVCIAVTLNRITSTLTIWQVDFSKSSIASSRAKTSATNYRKRQSSNVHDLPRTASGRAPVDDPRKSFGGVVQSFVDDEPKPQSSQLSNIEHLAAELGQDFEPAGVQTRSARRISSMLARTDLAPATDRSTFNDTNVASRKSLSRNLRKEGSIASFTERNSFAGRKSFPARASFVSNTTSFLESGMRLSFSEGIAGMNMEDTDLEDTAGKFDKDMNMIKLKSFTCHSSSAANGVNVSRVLVIPHPNVLQQENSLQRQLSVCVLEVQPQLMTVVTIGIRNDSPKDLQQPLLSRRPELKAIQMHKGTNIADACLVSDGIVSRLLVLSKTSQGDDVLHLEAPWSPSFRINLPKHYFVHKQDGSLDATNRSKHDVGLHHVLPADQINVSCFKATFNTSRLVFADTLQRDHELRVVLQPEQFLARRVIQLGRFYLPTQLQDSLLVAYWEVESWLESQDASATSDLALAVVLFTMAVPFISTLQTKSTTPGRKKKTRMSSGSSVDTTNLMQMQALERRRGTSPWMQNAAWCWISNDVTPSEKRTSSARQTPLTAIDLFQPFELRSWLLKATDLTRDFLQSPSGESMIGPEGYLPTAINQDWNVRRTTLANMVVALYLLLEELRLGPVTNTAIVDDRVTLLALLWQLCSWMQWQTWKDFMQAQLTAQGFDLIESDIDKSTIDNLKVPPEPFSPLLIFDHIDSNLRSHPSTYHTLVELVHAAGEATADGSLLIESARLLPHTAKVLAMIEGNSPRMEILPGNKHQAPSIVLPEVLKKSVLSSQPRTINSGIVTTFTSKYTPTKSSNNHAANPVSHIASRDMHAICTQALDTETMGKWDVVTENDRQAVTRSIFSEDRRFQEAARLVNQARPPEVEYDPQPNWTEADALEAQKLLAQYATRRTFAVVSGRGLMFFNARTPLLTEMVPRAQFSMQCVLRPKSDTEGGQTMTFSADRALFTEDKVSWAFFHNGASAGLTLSKSAHFIDTSWILYNKPAELTNRYAGFLLALGLNGHLKTLAKWVAFKYLTPKHTMTSIGLLLGLAASYRGTADTLTTRLLSVHVTCLLPPGAAELNLSPLTQTTGLIGIGLLYHDTQHRRMSDVMVAEIENQEPEERSGDEPILRDEGYRLAAGLALGLINLGHGLRLQSLHSMRVVERLLAIAIGTKNVHLVHVLDRATAGAVIATAFMFLKTNDASIARKIDVPDTQNQFEYVRPDVFLLRTLARHLIMWDSMRPEQTFIKESLPQQHQFRFDLQTVKRLVTNDLPFFHIVAGICFALALKFAGSQRPDVRDLLLNYLDQFLRLSRMTALSYDAKVTLNGIRNCLDILALSCSTVMAGSGDLEVYRRLRALHGRIDKDTPYGSHLASHMAIGSLFLSGGMATFGTSNLAVASLVIAFYPLFPVDVLDNRAHLQALRHLWVLAVEHRCLILRDADNGQVLSGIEASIQLEDGSISSLRTPCLLSDLDIIRAIYIAQESYWPVTRVLDELVVAPNDDQADRPKPQTLRDIYKASSSGISITLHRLASYDKADVDSFEARLQAEDQAHGLPSTSAPGTTVTRMTHDTSSLPTVNNLTGWIFDQAAFRRLDHAERELALSNAATPISEQDDSAVIVKQGKTLLATTPLDTHLELDLGTLGPDRLHELMRRPLSYDKVWQVKLLLSWADRMAREKELDQDVVMDKDKSSEDVPDAGQAIWLKEDVIDILRWKIWKLCQPQTNDEQTAEVE